MERALGNAKLTAAEALGREGALREVASDALGDPNPSQAEVQKVRSVLEGRLSVIESDPNWAPREARPTSERRPVGRPSYEFNVQAEAKKVTKNIVNKDKELNQAVGRFKEAVRAGVAVEEAEDRAHGELRRLYSNRVGDTTTGPSGAIFRAVQSNFTLRLRREAGVAKKGAQAAPSAPPSPPAPQGASKPDGGPPPRRASKFWRRWSPSELEREAARRRKKLIRRGVAVDANASPQAVFDQYEAHQRSRSAGRSRAFARGLRKFGTQPSQAISERPGPLGTFVGSLRLVNRQVRVLLAVVVIVSIAFIPVGVFKFAGWGVAALVMAAISALYFVFLNGLKAAASVVVTGINTVYTAVAGTLVRIMEAFMDWLNGGLEKVGQSPSNTCDLGDGAVVESSFCSGRKLLAEGFIPASELRALNIPLLDPNSIKPTMSSETLLDFLARQLNIKLDLGAFFLRLFPGMSDFVQQGNIYLVALVFGLPLIAIALLFYFYVLRPGFREAGLPG